MLHGVEKQFCKLHMYITVFLVTVVFQNWKEIVPSMGTIFAKVKFLAGGVRPGTSGGSIQMN